MQRKMVQCNAFWSKRRRGQVSAFHPCNWRNCICHFLRGSKRQKRLVLCANLFAWRWDLQGLLTTYIRQLYFHDFKPVFFLAFFFVALSSYADENHTISWASLVETSLKLIGNRTQTEREVLFSLSYSPTYPPWSRVIDKRNLDGKLLSRIQNYF